MSLDKESGITEKLSKIGNGCSRVVLLAKLLKRS